MNSYEIA